MAIAPPPRPAASSPEAVVRLMFDARDHGDTALVIALSDPDIQAETIAGLLVHGRAGVAAYFAAEATGSVRTEISAHELVVDDDQVTVHGRLRTIDADGLVDSPAAWTFTVRDGLVTRIEPARL